jgi:hypothetical protein
MDRRKGIVSTIALTSFLFCGMTAPQQCSQPKNNGHGVAIAVAAVAVVAVGTVVLVAVHESHHNLKGCVYNDNDGLHLQEGDATKKYLLSGATTHIKPGDVVRVHGSKVKKEKGSTDDQMFVVQELKKDYGLCPAQPAPAPVGQP